MAGAGRVRKRWTEETEQAQEALTTAGHCRNRFTHNDDEVVAVFIITLSWQPATDSVDTLCLFFQGRPATANIHCNIVRYSCSRLITQYWKQRFYCVIDIQALILCYEIIFFNEIWWLFRRFTWDAFCTNYDSYVPVSHGAHAPNNNQLITTLELALADWWAWHRLIQAMERLMTSRWAWAIGIRASNHLTARCIRFTCILHAGQLPTKHIKNTHKRLLLRQAINFAQRITETGKIIKVWTPNRNLLEITLAVAERDTHTDRKRIKPKSRSFGD